MRLLGTFVASASLAAILSVPLVGQSVRPPSAAKPFAVPRTSWGDPDLQGTYTNNDESGIPLERPAQFDGKRLEDIDPAELAKLNDQREEQREESAPLLGVLPGSNPVHWFENFGAKNSRIRGRARGRSR